MARIMSRLLAVALARISHHPSVYRCEPPGEGRRSRLERVEAQGTARSRLLGGERRLARGGAPGMARVDGGLETYPERRGAARPLFSVPLRQLDSTPAGGSGIRKACKDSHACTNSARQG